ncbi:hypothetical protein AF332_20215 [Sporosarcina globispora]|uniref:Uncharacterized protein n=1 Tax=Sporosarcina globispora TaxID=1459 RepID=A0A0M0GG99_SPOGL|nr:hypothetical protein [Sporosarcina globispora]KON88894.1 hypothetical protein AF332_20215 [Sporosarcina globispora]
MPNKRINLEKFGFINNKNQITNDNETINSVGHSGNSDIDMNIEVKVDTTAIGFAILCSLFATGQLTDLEFRKATRKLEELTNEKMGSYFGNDINDPSGVRLYKAERK